MITEFTIDRRIWLRGEKHKNPPTAFGPMGSYLLREIDRKRCCLGVYLGACGVPDADLEQVGSPGKLFRDNESVRKLIPEWLIGSDPSFTLCSNSFAASGLMEVNDDDSPDQKKEEFIINKFAEHGIRVTFV